MTQDKAMTAKRETQQECLTCKSWTGQAANVTPLPSVYLCIIAGHDVRPVSR